MNKKFVALSGVLCLPFLFTSCGGDSINTLLDSIPTIAITSPTAGSGSSSVSLRDGFFAAAEVGAPDEMKPLSEMLAEVDALKDKAATDIAAGVDLAFKKYTTNCYGPSLSWDMSSPTDPAARNLPGGDLGIWTDTESDGTACAAAQLNSLVGGANQVNEARDFLLAIVAAAGADGGVGLPGVGASVDMTSSAPAFTGITVTSATLERLADDSDGNAVYHTTVAYTVADAADLDELEMQLWHSPTAAGQKGLFQALVPGVSTMGGADVYRGISLVYNDDGESLTIDLRMGQNRTTVSTDFFNDTTGQFDATETGAGEDITRFLATFKKATSEATARYAWYAGGNMDGAARVFEVDVNVGDDGKRSGVGYFGFFEGAYASLPTTGTWIQKFFPNWTVGLATGAELANKCQGQTFAEDSSGILAPVTSNTLFAPENDGLGVGTYTLTSGGGAVARSVTGGTIELVAQNSMGTVPDVTAPSFSKP